MKKVTFIALAFAAVAALFTSCKSEDKAAPEVSFTVGAGLTINAAGDSIIKTAAITEDSATITFNYAVSAEAEIATLKAGVKGTSMSPIEAAAGEVAYNGAVTIEVAAGTTVFEVTVTDKDDVSLTKEVKIIVTKEASLSTVTFTDENGASIIGAGESSYGSYIDLDGGKIYHMGSVPDNQAAIDAVFNLTSLYDQGTGFTSTNCKFGTTTIDANGFNAATESALTGLTADKTEITVSEGAVIYFKTGAGKEGLILIKTLTVEAGNKNKITIEVKLKS